MPRPPSNNGFPRHPNRFHEMPHRPDIRSCDLAIVILLQKNMFNGETQMGEADEALMA